MEEKRQNKTLWIVLAAIAGLLVGCLVGAAAGGVVGYWAGKRAAPVGRLYGPFGFRSEPEIPLPEIVRPKIPEGWPEIEIAPLGEAGGLVVGVHEDSPAEDAGLREGDVIVEIDGQPLDQEGSLGERISEYDPGDEIELVVIRQGRERTIKVGLGEQPGKRGVPWLGIDYRAVTDVDLHLEAVPSRIWRYRFPRLPKRGD